MTSPEYEVSEDEAPAPVPAPAPSPAPAYGSNSPGNDPVISDLNEDSDLDMVADNNDSREELEEHVKRQLQQQEDEQKKHDAKAQNEYLKSLDHEQRIAFAMLQERLRKRAQEDREEEAIMLKAAYTRTQMHDAQGELGVRTVYPPNHIMNVPEINRAYKRRMKQTHPDKGGNVEDSQRALAAMNRLLHIEKYGLL
jgi:hypothetical protein